MRVARLPAGHAQWGKHSQSQMVFKHGSCHVMQIWTERHLVIDGHCDHSGQRGVDIKGLFKKDFLLQNVRKSQAN